MRDDDRTGATDLGGENGATEIHEAPDPKGAPLAAREAFLIAHERLAQLAAIARGPSVVAAAVSARGQVAEALLLGDGEALVIGRHTECELRLRDPQIALRHLVLHVSAQAGQPPTVRLWDLATGRPFRTEDGARSAAVIAEGFLYASIGPYAIVIAPASALQWAASAAAAWDALPPRQFIDRRDGRPQPKLLAGADDFGPSTHVTQVRPASSLGEGEGPPWAELRILYGKDRQKSVPVALEHLQRGVLIGRYDRCGVKLALDGNISRVHLLLVRIAGDLWAIDTASTNGTRADGKRLSAAILGDDDWVELGETRIRLNLRRLQHAAA
jgi:hypothetical protein